MSGGMSERTAQALTKIDAFLPALQHLPASPVREELIEIGDALRRAVSAFHMEAIRFRMYSVDRLIKTAGDDPTLRTAFDDVRQALETAGFHTRSHTAP
jgi:hypothetical protein